MEQLNGTSFTKMFEWALGITKMKVSKKRLANDMKRVAALLAFVCGDDDEQRPLTDASFVHRWRVKKANSSGTEYLVWTPFGSRAELYEKGIGHLVEPAGVYPPDFQGTYDEVRDFLKRFWVPNAARWLEESEREVDDDG